MDVALVALVALGGFILYEAVLGLKGASAAPQTASSGGGSTASIGQIRNYGGVQLSDAPVYPVGTVLSQAQITQMARNAGFSGQGLANILHVISIEAPAANGGGDPNALYNGPIHSDAAGILQYISTTAKQWGVNNRLDPQAALNGAFAATKGGTDWCNSPWCPDIPGCGGMACYG